MSGRLSLVSVSHLLETMQENKNTGELRLKTDFGPATVWFDGGQLVDAEIGSFQGEAAVIRLLGLTDGSFTIKSMPVRRPRLIDQPVHALLRRRRQRSIEWKKLVERVPPLSTVLVLDLQSFSVASGTLDDDQLAVVQLVDGRRAIFEIIDDSGLDAVEVLRLIDGLITKGLVSSDPDQATPSPPRDSREGESGVLPPADRSQEPPRRGLPVGSEMPPSSTDPTGALAALAAPAPSLLPPVRGGPRLGRYEVLSRLGRGGMGTVYLARITGQGGFRRLFAVKVLRSHLSDSDEATEMLLKEARIASRMNHPNIVSVVDVGSHEGQPYLVMDYVTGCSLADLLKARSRKATTAAAVQIILDTLAGLHAAHTLADDDGVSLDVIHHDVSPHNIMVGRDGIARLSDFGVAYVRRHVEGGEETNRGKPAYTAPERVRGGPGDKRSDLFSVGVILWTALTRVPLFEAGDIETTLDNVLDMPVPPASRHGHSPESLDEICFRALHRSPVKRYQSADEMMMHLRRVAASEDLFSTMTDVREWVNDAMAANDVDVDRLSFLDAARMERKQAESSALISARHIEERPLPPPPADASRTVGIAKSERERSARAKWVAVWAAVVILLLTVLWPGLTAQIDRWVQDGESPMRSTVP